MSVSDEWMNTVKIRKKMSEEKGWLIKRRDEEEKTKQRDKGEGSNDRKEEGGREKKVAAKKEASEAQVKKGMERKSGRGSLCQ